MAWMSGRAAAMTANERIVRNTTTCETRGAFDHANLRCGAAIYVVLVVHVRLMSTPTCSCHKRQLSRHLVVLAKQKPRNPSNPAPGSRRLSTGFSCLPRDCGKASSSERKVPVAQAKSRALQDRVHNPKSWWVTRWRIALA